MNAASGKLPASPCLIPNAVAWMICLVGVLLSACATADRGYQTAPPPVEERGEELDRTLAEMPPSVQRRLLRHINEARTPEDLQKFPQRMRLEFEHGLPEGAERYKRLNIDEKLLAGRTEEMDGYKVPVLDVDAELARLLLAERPLNGYPDLRDALLLHWKRWQRLIADWVAYFGPRVFGRWDELPVNTGEPIMHAALLRTGKVVMLPSGTDTVIWDPAAGVSIRPGATTGLTADLFCSGHSFLADGTLFAVGGGGGSPGAASSIQGWRFDPGSETWKRTADMHYMRWYPTTVTLDDERDRVLVASGWTTGTNPAPHMELYDPAADTFTLVSALGPVGEKLFGQTYPGLHQISKGQVFYAPTGFGDCTQTANPWLGTEPSGSFKLSAPAAGAWTDTGANVRTKGMSVPILRATSPQVRVVTFGGGNLSDSGTARSIDLSAAFPAWGFAFPLLEKRVHPNAVLLPDGTVFVSGGMEPTSPTPPNGGPSEMYDPDSGAIFEMDDLHHPRHYHSVSLLLPSGKVMATAGASSGGCSLSVENTIEVFSPPYLFRGPRPVIAAVPGTVSHGEEFALQTPNASDITKVVLVRPMAVTHQTDSEQRVIPLKFTPYGGGELRVRAPGGSAPYETAPRGYYLVFILNAAGVPSEGQFVRLD